jgi:hypothetical protein
MKRMIESDTASIKLGHAFGAREEMKTIADEFRVLAEQTSIPTPAMDRLYRHLDPTVEPISEGSADLSLWWLRQPRSSPSASCTRTRSRWRR